MKVMWVTLRRTDPDLGCRWDFQEIAMRALSLAIATLLLASGAAQAQYTIEYGGRTIHIDPDRGTVSIPGVFDNTGKRAKRGHTDQDTDRPQKQTPQQQTTVDPQPGPSQVANPPAQATAPAAQSPAPVNAAPPPSTATANTAPADTAALPPPPAPAPPPVQQTLAPVATTPAPPPPPAPTVAAVPPPAPPPAPAAAPPRNPNSPVGVWLTEEKEGKVRIEPCGANLCGYSVDAKSDQNGEQVLINMKPGQDQKWSGRIHDPNTGSNYDSTIALKGTDTLRVQGCAFGGMFCGGQTWTRVN
jgi:Uncharacterized protein conserved in bacteria (DUF2147)